MILKGDGTKEVLSSFTCSLDADIELFLHERAIEFEKISKARTYLICDEAKLREGEIFIVGYFALSLKVLILPEEMPVRSRKEYDGFRGKIHGNPIREIPCYLIGQLARNSEADINSITGSELIETTLSVIQPSVDAVGGRWVLIECHNTKGLVDFYRANGFHTILQEPDGDMEMVQMIRKIA